MITGAGVFARTRCTPHSALSPHHDWTYSPMLLLPYPPSPPQCSLRLDKESFYQHTLGCTVSPQSSCGSEVGPCTLAAPAPRAAFGARCSQLPSSSVPTPLPPVLLSLTKDPLCSHLQPPQRPWLARVAFSISPHDYVYFPSQTPLPTLAPSQWLVDSLVLALMRRPALDRPERPTPPSVADACPSTSTWDRPRLRT